MKAGKSMKYITVGLSAFILLSSNVVTVNATEIFTSGVPKIDLETIKFQIPTSLEPGAILTYDVEQEPTITYDTSAVDHATIKSKPNLLQAEVPDIEGRAAEDEFFKTVAESVKNLPVTDLGYDLPEPSPGTVVIYGSDGHINRIYQDENIGSKQAIVAADIPTSTVPYPGRLPAGTYTYGSGQKVIISAGAVTGEGRFTVFRAGVGGSGTVGSSNKILGAGDVATKRQIDNAVHGTPITARALDTNIVKTVYKNDIGSLPDAVLDNYFWGWNNVQFGYTYSDTLSFSGRYYYQF
ncbi:hypothetical protein [Paenibacillus sp. DMB5]|uniref:hypothetical protein n=1 Tax=Paenibacillus sp. DMB5 TaxID=1780103 RepID=UPI00076D93E8|nr:hypothetical protein [Paenibacillus sp. DMB5]KUP23396.1 hypothetical protein AWJ19_28920 [Paenibacillus sp. DMB5]